eukprot:1195774-Prorocentrum_minimum.AAC.5
MPLTNTVVHASSSDWLGIYTRAGIGLVRVAYCTVYWRSVPLQAGPNPDGLVPNEGSTSEVVNGHGV